MVKYLKSYEGNRYRIFVVSRDKSLTMELLKQGIEVGEIDNYSITFYPDGLCVNLNEKELKEIEILSERDICEISSDGIIYRWYSSVEGDAGIATTARCNSNCLMCPASDSERNPSFDISIDRIIKVIKYMPTDLSYFTITGGEPTLVGEENFLKIYKVVKKHLPNTKILLLTNGRTLGNRKFFDEFSILNTEKLRIAIPIHGSSAKLHDYITQAPGGFIQTMRGIKNVINAGVELELRIVVSKLNYKNLLDIAKLIRREFHAVRIVHFIGLEMRGNCAKNSKDVVISYEDAFNYSILAIKYLMVNGIDVALYNFPYCMINKKFWPIAKKSISTYKSNFYDECNSCMMKNMCCGIFTATKDFYKPKVYPITKEEL